MSVREGAPQGRQGSQVKDLAPRNAGWVVVRGNMHGDVRCPRRARWSEPLSAPRPSSHVSGSALRAALCQEESLPGHHGSPGAAMQRMSALSAGRAVPSDPLPTRPLHKDTPQHAHSRGAPSPRQRDYGRRALFILNPVPGNSAGRRPGAPPWVGAGGSPSLVTRVTDPLRETTQKAPTSLPAKGLVFWPCRSLERSLG